MFAKTTQRLCWKELKQVIPLAITLVALGICLQAAFMASSDPMPRYATMGIMLGLPGLFAVGAGALMVGQEKEQRTLYWLNSLPLPADKIFWSKLAIACGVLSVLWSVAVAIAAVFSLPQGGLWNLISSSITADSLIVATWPLHSLFILLSGFALAWHLQNSLKALALLLPVAFAPMALASVVTQTILENSGSYSVTAGPSIPALLGCQAIGCVIALVVCYRNAIAALSPARPVQRPKLDSRLSKPRTVPNRLLTARSALLWQNFTQSKWLLLSALAIVSVPASLGLVGLLEPFPPIAFLAGGLAICILGVSTFQGDQLNQRVRFMADRGITPGRLWWTRLIMPGVTALACLALLFLTWLIDQRLELNTFAALTALGIVLAVSAWVFVSAQWASQIATTPIVAAIVGFAVGAGATVYFVTCIETLGTPLWLAVAIAALPLLATRLAARRWMDCTRGRPFWCIHAATLALLAIIPSIPLVITLATSPKPSAEFLSAMEPLSPSLRLPHMPLTTGPTQEVRNNDPQERLPSELLSLALSRLESRLQQEDVAFTCDWQVEHFVRNQLALESLRLRSEPNRTQRFAQVVSVATKIASRLREHPRLLEQDTADRIEIALLRELLSPSAELLPERIRQSAVELLSDREARKRSRQHAISAALHATRATDIGGYYRAYANDSLSQLSGIKRRRESEWMLEQLWLISEAGDNDTSEERRIVAEFWNVSEAYYGLGPDGDLYRGDDPLLPLANTWRGVPGRHWQAGWERIAETLK